MCCPNAGGPSGGWQSVLGSWSTERDDPFNYAVLNIGAVRFLLLSLIDFIGGKFKLCSSEWKHEEIGYRLRIKMEGRRIHIHSLLLLYYKIPC